MACVWWRQPAEVSESKVDGGKSAEVKRMATWKVTMWREMRDKGDRDKAMKARQALTDMLSWWRLMAVAEHMILHGSIQLHGI